jgi:AraC-like DNA-binding protein
MKAILETIPRDARHSFGFFDYQEKDRFRCPFHYHPECELTLVVHSTGQRYIGDHIGRFAEGDLVLMGPNLPHSYINDRKSPARAHSRCLQFLPDCLGAGFLQCGEARGIRALLEKSRLGLSFHGRVRDQTAAALGRLDDLEGMERLISFLEILRLLAASREFRPLATPGYSPARVLYQGERINRACDLITRKFRDPITQAEAARAARMSPPSFSRFFRRATSKTFRAFLNEVRIGHATRALLETDRTVAEICYDSGFSNLSNFNRQFLRLLKSPPRAYREKFRRVPAAKP